MRSEEADQSRAPMTILLQLLFFASGATALIYEVTWVRSLTLVFGGSHLAVTTVLTVFMAGLALGGRWFGVRADRSGNPLRLYGRLELGIALGAATCMALSAAFHTLYAPLANVAPENRAWLSTVRVVLATLAMLPPTTLMGGTLPVLVRFLTDRHRALGRDLACLYAINTFGAVAGAALAGFVLLRNYGTATTQWIAIGTNVLVGAIALGMARGAATPAVATVAPAAGPTTAPENGTDAPAGPSLPILVGAGTAGFCALGYEVLWTRTLSLVVGTSTYSFTIILVAFLVGIAGGSQLFAIAHRRLMRGSRSAWNAYAMLLAAIGVTALVVTFLMRDLTLVAPRLQEHLAGDGSEFTARQLASFAVATGYVLVPALLLGAAFPMAGALLGARSHGGAGHTVGNVLLWNTLGAVLGAATTGFLLVPALGYERALQLLAVLQLAVAANVWAAAHVGPTGRIAVAAAAVAVVAAVPLAPDGLRQWDRDDLATYMNNTRWAFATAEAARATREQFAVVYFHEGTNETISVLDGRDGLRTFVVNGRPEASTAPADMQLQFALGHIPALLHPAPKSAFVLGTGSGMTLGAVAAHPEIQRIVLAEIEPAVLPATRAFAEWNHGVLDDPRLHIVGNDGRNHLATTTERFDVITADPIHPWAGGAAYLYTAEYFRLVHDRLAPGGVTSQWLPLYELSVDDIRCIVHTFAAQFAHAAVFVTWTDAVLVASDSPLDLDDRRLAERMAAPAVAGDLARVGIGSARDLLAYFVLGDAGIAAYTAGATLNTDDNLWLEFSAPRSMGVFTCLGENIAALARCRESLQPYLPPTADDETARRRANWTRALHEAGRIYDTAHALGANERWADDDYRRALVALLARHPTYAPYKFLQKVQPF